MASLKFQNWPFKKGEKVSVHWFRSPYREPNGEWVFDIVFRRLNGAIDHTATIPWGALPWLRIGQYVIDGKPMNNYGRGDIKELNLYIDKGMVVPARRVIDKKLYKLFFPENYNELCWVTNYRNKILVVPIIEVIRAFLAPSKFLANAILNPTGFQSLIDYAYERNTDYYLKLSNVIPKSYITPGLVNHMVWLLNNPIAKESWDKVYQSMFIHAIDNNPLNPISEMNKDIKISTVMPLQGKSLWKSHVLEDERTILVLDIISASGLTPPYRKIIVEHEGIGTKNVEFNKLRKGINSRNGKKDEQTLDQTLTPSFETKVHPYVTIQPTTLQFSYKPNVKIISNKEIVNVSYNDHEDKNRDKSEDTFVTVVESAPRGKVKPVEFQSLNVEFSSLEGSGLEEFIKAINHLRYFMKDATIDIQIGEIPGDKGIAFVTDNVRRKYAAVLVKAPNVKDTLVIEVGRPDNHSISTLFIKPKKYFERWEEVTVSNTLAVLIKSNGFWSKEVSQNDLNNNYLFLKHFYKDSTKTWCKKIVEKIYLLMK